MGRLPWKPRRQLLFIDSIFILLGTFVGVQVLLITALFPVDWLTHFLPGGETTINKVFLQQLLQSGLMLGLTLFVLYRLRGGNLRNIGLYPLRNWRWLFYAMLCGMAVFFVMLYLSAWLVRLFPQWATPQAITTVIMQAKGVWERLAVLFMVGVLAPISEEFLFRGYMYHSLRTTYPAPVSMLLTAMLFGCVHFDWLRLLPLTFVGFCLNWILVKSGSLWSAIIMHGTWNVCMALLIL